jgi:hypothetical protein
MQNPRAQVDRAFLFLGALASAVIIADGLVRLIAWVVHG